MNQRSQKPTDFEFGEKEYVPLEEDPNAVVFKAPSRNPKEGKKESMNATPTPLNARKNIERQKSEQRTWNTILSSAASMVLIGVLLVGGLACFGGYVLWSQIKKQSVTISLLESNLRKEIARAEDERSRSEAKLSSQQEAMQGQLNTFRARFDSNEATLRTLRAELDQERALNRRQEANLAQLGRANQRIENLERMTSRR